MAERCLCGHDWWDHAASVVNNTDPVRICDGDFGMCECEEFIYLGDEEEAT